MSFVGQDAIASVNDKQPIALAINLGTNFALSLLTLGAFCWLRPKNGVIYAKKYKSSPEEKRAPKLNQGYFSWVRPVWSCPDEELVEKIGLDAVVFIRFVRMCRNLFFIMGVVGCGALIPINIISTMRAEGGQWPKDKVSMLTIAGISDLNWLWAHVGAVWFFSLVVIFALHHGYRTFLAFRTRYFESETYQEEVASRTIMLAGLPTSLQTDNKLFKFMNDMGLSDKPVQALVGRKVDKLPELMDKHKKTVEMLEQVVAKYFADPNRKSSTRPTVKIGGFCGSKVDAIDYYSQQIEELNDQIEMVRGQVSKSQPTNYGFVSYSTIHAAHRVAKELSSAIVYRKRSKMIDPPDLFLSPIPKDIIWFNVANPKQLRKSRRLIVNVAFVVFSLLFFIPMGFLTTLAKLDRIIGLIPSSKDYFDKHAVVAGFLQSLLPVLFMDILFLIIRKLISYLAWFQGNITKSSTDRSTLAKFYLFFTINNLIIFALTGTIMGFFTQIRIIIAKDNSSFSETLAAIMTFARDQDNIVKLLSKNVIDTSLFWVNYISLRNFGALLDLFQLVSLVLYWAKNTLTPRESKKLNKPDVFDFPLFFSVHMFLLTVALLYSVVAPLVLFFAFIYFSLASLVYKYQLMYVFRTRVETGGRLFRVVYNRLLVALILFQVIMIGVLNLKMALKHSLAIVPLPFLTILFKMFLSKRYDPRIDFYDYGAAREERHPSRGGKNVLLMNFENPILNTKIISALVPDDAKKMLSQKVLHGGNRSENKNSNKARPTHSPGPSRNQSTLHSQRDGGGKNHEGNMETYEMGHVRKGSTKHEFQVLGSDPYDSLDTHHTSRTQSPLSQQSGHHASHTESPTQSTSQRYGDAQNTQSNTASQPRKEKEYGAQDMTSFVAGRYKADRAADPYSYSSNNRSKNNGGDAAGPSYLELAKMHQTDSYKNTGKATQYEDKRALNFAKNGRHQTRQQQLQQQDPFSHDQDVQDGGLDQITPSIPSTPTTPKPTRMHLPEQPSSSPRKAHRDARHSPSPSHDLKPMGRAQTQPSVHYSGHNTKHNNDQMVTELGRANTNNDSYSNRQHYQDSNV